MILLLIFLVPSRNPSLALHRLFLPRYPYLLRYLLLYFVTVTPFSLLFPFPFLPYHQCAMLTHTALVEILRSQKDQTHFYWGTTWRGDEEDRWPKEMWGSGYILSWDLVSWISTSPIPADNADGFEDYQVCAWLIEGTPRESRLHTIPVCTIPSCPE